MKFDIVIGNPPYQKPDEGHGSSATPIYHKFVEKIVDEINPEHFTFIIPAKWYIGGKEPKSFRKRMIADTHLKTIKDYEKNIDIFPGVHIGGGVMWFHRDKSYNGPCTFNGKKYNLKKYKNIIIRHLSCHSLLDKILIKTKHSISEHVQKRGLFGIIHSYTTFDNENDENAIPCFTHKGKLFIKKEKVVVGLDFMSKYKAMTSKGYGCGLSSKRIIAKPWVMCPNEVCSETYIVLFASEDEKIVQNFISYSHTKFFRFLVFLKTITQHYTAKTFAFVPQMDYSEKWTDEKLYEHFNLSLEDIKAIEELIVNYK